MGKCKRLKEIEQLVESKEYKLIEALDVLKQCSKVKFDESVEFSLKLGVDQKKADQQVRGNVILPNGTGKTIKILVVAKGEQLEEAKKAKADFFGSEDIIEKLKGGFLDFDVIVATPDMMRELGKLGKILGPRGLMPTPKSGTVTTNIASAVEELKKGKVEFKIDKGSVINVMVGKISFTQEKLKENITTLYHAILSARPAAAKGNYIQSFFLSTTMGPGIKVELQSIG